MLVHRWLAIGTCLLFVAWFVSGLVMLYVSFPELRPSERLAALERIDWRTVRLSPDDAMRIAGLAEYPRELCLTMMAGEPVWRIRTMHAGALSVSAVDGRVIDHVSAESAQAIARAFSRTERIQLEELVSVDQWTVAGTFDPHRPLYRVAVADAARTELYVSSRTGEVVLDTNHRERIWNWAGSVIHWLYFRDLRANAPVWRQVVLWTSGIGIVVALTGLWLGVDRMRIRKRYAAGRVTPFRGLMAWHHIAGLVGGLCVATWIVSGWLSMEPALPWESPAGATRSIPDLAAYAGHSQPDFNARLDELELDAYAAREASFMWLEGSPQIVLSEDAHRSTLVDGRTGEARALRDAQLFEAAAQLLPHAHLVGAVRLEREDAYWYSRRDPPRLPVLRAIFDDPAQTWFHIDPNTGMIFGRLDARDRTWRWLFNALHSLDFRWLLAHRPAWDTVMWVLSLAGLAISVSGVVIGWRRLRG